MHYKLVTQKLEIRNQRSSFINLHDGDDKKFDPDEPQADQSINGYLSHVEQILRENKIEIELEDAYLFKDEPRIDESTEFYEAEVDMDNESDMTTQVGRGAAYQKGYRALKKAMKEKVDMLKQELAEEQARSN